VLFDEAIEELIVANNSGSADRIERAKGALAWGAKSQGAARLAAMVTIARTFPAAIVRHDALDVDPWLLNLTNGTLDLRTGKLREHRRADLITKIAPVACDPTATAPTWDAFLVRA